MPRAAPTLSLASCREEQDGICQTPALRPTPNAGRAAVFISAVVRAVASAHIAARPAGAVSAKRPGSKGAAPPVNQSLSGKRNPQPALRIIGKNLERTMNPQEARLVRHDYVLGHSPDEYGRLRRQGQTFEAVTRRLFHAIGLQPGWTCLDLGCGPGETMRLMGEIVGPSGEVTGLDRDPKAGRDAIERLQAAGTSRYRFIEADMESADDIGGELFDFTFARLALLFTRDPVAVLRRMYRWTKPGGTIAVQDLYVRTINLYPKLEAGSELARVILETCTRSGQDMEFAFKLPVYFVDAGIGAPDGTDINLPMTPLAPFIAHHQALCRSLLPRAIELGVTTQARMQCVFRDIERAAADERQYSALWPAMIGVWKRKPMR
jgi:SAM-dependent methyltransferase